ncbi:MAG: hypothetical protein CSA70_03505 [Rhodobacterales bacterium]|nr:MAG: hypothetical protein CSA70_03505 [Rhodobacterales bacterium]
MALQGTNPTQVANSAKLSPNTLSKFTNGSTETLSERSLAKILPVLGLERASELDTDNPINDPKTRIHRIIDKIPEEDLPALLREFQSRFPA